ncbi:MAG: PKD domain-containing protein [Bacteroidota bacterium]
MRKLYALLAGFVLTLLASTPYAQTVATPDVANFTFTVNHATKHVVFTNTSTLGNQPGIRRAFWSFGDGTGTWTPPLQGTQHQYQHPGTYTVCLKIFRYRPNHHDSILSAQVCKTVVINTVCRADFKKLPVATVNNPLLATFKALPWHNDNKKPQRICWRFGDGSDTCINYPVNYTGQYLVRHRYNHPGIYEVCVKIDYYGGCEARKCKPVRIGRPDSCRADFVKLPVATVNNPLLVTYKALPWHNNNKKPQRICWRFGDGSDTCINYPANYTGQYLVRHRYNQPGIYEVCVKINYFGGCEARKCKPVRVGSPDSCRADFVRLPVTANNPLKVAYKALPWHNNNKKPKTICWRFGDGSDTCINYPASYTGQYIVRHRYAYPGLYEVCVKIDYYGGCDARKCKNIQVGRPDSCRADFERVPVPANDPLDAAFRALPWHNNNRKPARICWKFGDGEDTCINYPQNYTGLYGVRHRYDEPGRYEVCVKIDYYGGCDARKCRDIQIGRPDSCRADFERVPLEPGSPLLVGFKALPWHNNDKKPKTICWRFGDGEDTCINYPANYTGRYGVVHRYQQPGEYEVCVKIEYYGGCDARKCREIVVHPPVNCSVRLFEITPSITSLVRGFLAVPHSTPPRRPVRICWYFGDGEDTCIMIEPGQPISSFFIRHTYPGPGVYRACVRIRFEGGCVAEDCKEVVIRSASNVCGGFMIDSLIAPRTFKFRGFSINVPNDEVIRYRWTFGDGSAAVGREVTHTYAHGGNYEVCLYIKTRLGCETRVCRTVRVPGNNEPALNLSPNPVINMLHAAFFSTHTEQVSIKILNNNGVQVRSYIRNATVGANNWDFDLSSLLPGIYSFVVHSPNQLASAIFIKQ